jgi:NAD(P)-dependent dehydrogenase (short-subunit alcohol dehydrogenase family)
VQDDEKILRFVNSKDAPRLAELGTSCPDHFLRTKIKPLYVDWNPQAEDFAALKKKLAAGLEAYRKDYAAYYAKCKHANSPAMRDPNPTVVLIPGLGMIAWGKDKSESRVTAEFYNCAVEVMRGAEAIDKYIALPQQEAFDIEYWLLEEAKLKRMPAEKELARQVIVVVGAGSGIGKETAHRIVEGRRAHRVCGHEARDRRGHRQGDHREARPGHRRRRHRHLGCGPAVGLAGNITDRASVRAMLDQVALAYGGFDSICVTAGVFWPSDTTGHIPDDKWAFTFNVNVTGSYIVGDEAFKTWKEQGLKGSSSSPPPPTPSWRRRAASPTTRRRPPPTTSCASSPSSWRRWCASMASPRRPWCRVRPCSRATASSVRSPNTTFPTRTTRRRSRWSASSRSSMPTAR